MTNEQQEKGTGPSVLDDTGYCVMVTWDDGDAEMGDILTLREAMLEFAQEVRDASAGVEKIQIMYDPEPVKVEKDPVPIVTWEYDRSE